jgi:excisionase family DNA binding protein
MLIFMRMVNDNTENKKFFSTQEVADLLNISRVAVFKKIKKGEIKAEKVGRNYIIPAENLSEIFGNNLTDKTKDKLSSSVDKVISDYGETIKLLGNE